MCRVCSLGVSIVAVSAWILASCATEPTAKDRGYISPKPKSALVERDTLRGQSQARTREAEIARILDGLGTPVSFDDAFASMSGVSRFKSEFETTKDFHERQAVSLLGLPSHFLVSAPVDLEYVKYDADRQVLVVSTYALTNTLVSDGELGALFGYGSELQEAGVQIQYSSLRNIAWAFPRDSRVVETYSGSNSFGATVAITKEEVAAKGIFERKAESDENIWFEKRQSATAGSPPVAFEIAVSPVRARELKASGLKAAVLFEPRPPYHAAGTDRFYPKLTAPIDRTTTVKYLIGDIKCAAIYDASDNLLARRLTQ